MRIYISGIGGVGMGAAARIARDLGYDVIGSDISPSRYTDELIREGFRVIIGQTSEQIAAEHINRPIDWLLCTAALPDDHAELNFARQKGIKISQRHDFYNHLFKEKNLKLISVAGTHGKTSTVGMLVWILQQLDIPVSYAIGTDISFGPSGHYEPESTYFIYENDEFDKQFLNYVSYSSIITSADYDHPDTYPTINDYKKAFREFATNSMCVYTWRTIAAYLDLTQNQTIHAISDAGGPAMRGWLKIPGEHARRNALLVIELMEELFENIPREQVVAVLEEFPGTGRRFEKLAPNLYSDYAHHPVEIASTLQLASEVNKNVIAVYQPHQNVRQHEIQDQYQDCFNRAKKTYWLPTYLSREHKNLEVLPPEHFIEKLSHPEKAEAAAMNQPLIEKINSHRQAGDLVLLMSAGSLDQWARENFVYTDTSSDT